MAVSAGAPFEGITSLKEYSIDEVQANETYSQYFGDKNVFCAEPVFGNFNIATNEFNFPQNCGIGVINVD